MLPIRLLRMISLIGLFFVLVFTLSACTQIDMSAPPPQGGADAPPQTGENTPPQSPPQMNTIRVGVGFIPNVQFAPFYVAQARGYFEEQGLEVELEYGFENDFVTLTATGERDFAVASGDQVVLARAQGLPLVYVMKWYERFPVAVMAKSETGIAAPEDLNGRTVGIPGLFGANYTAWKALVYTTDLDEDSVNLETIGFTQAEAISNDTVEAAVVYVTNEPVQLRQAGQSITVFEVSDYMDLISNGLVTNETVVQEKPELIRKLVLGLSQGIEYSIENPFETFEISRQFIPEMSDDDAPAQRAVLDAAIELWRSDRIGYSDPQAWTESAEFMLEAGLIEEPVEVESLYTNEFLP